MSNEPELTLLSKEDFKKAIKSDLLRSIVPSENLAYVRDKVAHDDYEDNHDLYKFHAKDDDNYQIGVLRIYLSILIHAKKQITARDGDSNIHLTFFTLRDHAMRNSPYYSHFAHVMGALAGIIASEGALTFPISFTIPKKA